MPFAVLVVHTWACLLSSLGRKLLCRTGNSRPTSDASIMCFCLFKYWNNNNNEQYYLLIHVSVISVYFVGYF